MPVPLRAMSWRRLLCLAPLGFAATSGGCYTYGPMPMMASGTDRVSVELLLNERGRADLVDRLGPDALAIEGELVTRRDSAVTVTVRNVRYINQSSSQWTGEALVVTTAQLRDIRQRRFSVARTGVAVGSVIGGLVAFIVTRSLTGGGDSPPDGGGGGGVVQ